MELGRVVSLDPPGYLSVLRSAPQSGVKGGRVYDAVLARTAMEANVDVLLTFNERHFSARDDGAFEVIVPA